jgi:hypothetical protein
MADIELRNATEHHFVDVSSEKARTYYFPGNEQVTILAPQFLNVSRSGHRILDDRGQSHYIPKGWIQLVWEVKEGEPHFVK